MKRWIVILLALASGGASAYANGWAHSPEYIARTNCNIFKGMTPRQIAPYLAHFSGGMAGGAIKAMVAHGEGAMPLVKELLHDTHPYLRAGAVAVLTAIHKHDGKGTRQVTPELRAATALIAHLIDDPHPEVQRALGGFVAQLRVETAETKRMVLKLAGHKDPGVRGRALSIARGQLTDPDTLIQIAILCSDAEGNPPRHWSLAYLIANKAPAHTRRVVPAIVRFLNHKAHTQRGMFSNGGYNRGLAIIERHWDKDLAATDGMVSALAKAYVRVPVNTFPGWVKAREQAKGLLEKLGPASAPQLRAAIAAEKKWIAETDAAELKRVLERPPAEHEPKLAGYIRFLTDLARKLEK